MNTDEFIKTVYPFKNKLFRIAKLMLRNAEDAEDAVQEVFIKLWNSRDRINIRKSIEGLAIVAVKNMCIDKIRANKQKVLQLNEDILTLNNSFNNHNLENTDAVEKVRQIIDKLPDNRKILIQLRDIEGYEYEEISKMMNMSVNAIKVNISRTRKQIKETMIMMHNYEQL